MGQRKYTDEDYALVDPHLGKMSDVAISKLPGVRMSQSNVYVRRRELGVPAYRFKTPTPMRQSDISRLMEAWKR